MEEACVIGSVTKGFLKAFHLYCHSSSPRSLSANSASPEEPFGSRDCHQIGGCKPLIPSPLLHLPRMQIEELGCCCGF